MHEDLAQVRSLGVNFYILRDAEGLYLIDCGFIDGIRKLKDTLLEKGWDKLPIVGVIVTHGHLDHILNVKKIADKYGAWIAAPRLDLDHYLGKPKYKGAARITGMLESIGRFLFNYQAFTPTRLLDDGDTLDIWHGLKIIQLPGHTKGHCGFYCEKLELLFCADLFASFSNFSHLPPHFFNHDSKQIVSSIEKALKLKLQGVLPNHAGTATQETHLERLKALQKNSFN